MVGHHHCWCCTRPLACCSTSLPSGWACDSSCIPDQMLGILFACVVPHSSDSRWLHDACIVFSYLPDVSVAWVPLAVAYLRSAITVYTRDTTLVERVAGKQDYLDNETKTWRRLLNVSGLQTNINIPWVQILHGGSGGMDSNDRTNFRSQAISLPLPKSFDGTAASWRLWSQRFDRFYYATQLHQKDRQEQVSVYLYAMGEPADDLLMVLQIDESKITYQELKGKQDQHFGDRKNVIVEKAKLNQRIQKPGEPIDNFIQDLHKLAAECEFGKLKEELIRDRIVVGVLSDSLSEELQAKPKLTLSLVIQISRQAEARLESQPLLGDTRTVYVLNQREQVKQKSPNFEDPAVPSSTAKHPSQTCSYCGRERHSRYQCPVRNATCAQCQKRGHYKIVCRSGRNKSIHKLFDDTDTLSDHLAECNFHMENKEDSEFFLGSLEQDYEEMWTATLKVNGHPTTFKLDTGAAVSVINSNEPWLKGITLQKADKILCGPGGSTISPLGAFKASISYQGRNIIETVYVLNNQSCTLLSKKACYILDMIRRVNSVKTTATKYIDSTSTDNSSLESYVRREFPDLFSGLGQVKTEYTIKLKENAQPTCIYTPRKIAHPLLPKVQAELENMIKLGVISPVSEPWLQTWLQKWILADPTIS